MRARLAIAALSTATTLVACNLLTGIGDLSTDDAATSADDAATDRVAAEGSTTPGDGSIADGGINDGQVPNLDAAYVCSGAACFDAGLCTVDGGPGGGPSTSHPCPVRIFAGGTGTVRAITADADGVYWTVPSARRIERLLATASHPDTLIAVPDGTPTELATSGGDVFWTESDSGRVRKISAKAAAGSSPSASISNQGMVGPIGIGNGGVALAWANAAGTVTSASTDFNLPTAVADEQSPVLGVGLYALQAFWGSAGSIKAIRGADDPKKNLAPAGDVRAIAVDSQRIYWADGTNGKVDSCEHNGSARMTVSGNEGEPVAMAVESNQLYWVNISDGRVRTAASGSAQPTTLVGGQSRPRAIAVSGSVVYWVNDTGGEVWALHRGP